MKVKIRKNKLGYYLIARLGFLKWGRCCHGDTGATIYFPTLEEAKRMKERLEVIS